MLVSLSKSRFAPAGSGDPAGRQRIWRSAASLCDLLSLVLFLEPQGEVEMPADLGRAVHAWFLDRVREDAPELAERLHEGHALRPFTLSPLRRTEERRCWLRITALEAELAEWLLGATWPEEITLGPVAYRLRGVTSDPQEHPWAGRTTYEALLGHLLGTEEPEARVELEFASPTTFRSRGHHLPLPLPHLVFGSYREKWNAFAPLRLPEAVLSYVEEQVVVARYRLCTRLVAFGEARFVGFVGSCRFLALRRDPRWLRVVQLLADFAFYAGTGHRTTVGLGQTRRRDGRAFGEAGVGLGEPGGGLGTGSG